MKNDFNFPCWAKLSPRSWIVLLISLLAAGLLWAERAAPVAAFANTPTPMPTPTAPNISVIVAAGGANIWHADTGSSLAMVAAGARLTATQRSTDNGWLYVQGADGLAGWVAMGEVLVFNTAVLPAQDVAITPVQPTATPAPTATRASQPVQPAEASQVATASNGQSTAQAQVILQGATLNIRSGPGASYAIIGKARTGDTFTVQGRDATGDWMQLTSPALPGGFGWVAAQYVRISGALAQLPISEQVNQTPSVAPPAPGPSTPANKPVGAPGLRGKIVFQTAWGESIYLYDLASGVLRQLTHGFDPSISPDGTQVAFTRLGGEHGLWLINVDGSNERKIFSERNAFFAPKWSPDGQALVFMRTDTTYDCEFCVREELRQALQWYRVRPRLARVDRNGDNYRDLASLDTATAPDWNSAGIVYTSEAGIQFTTPDGLDADRRVYYNNLQQHYRDPDWQPGPEGAPGRIVFQQRKGGHTDLFAVNLDGSGLTGLTRPVTVLVDALPSNVAPAWSPDGQHLVFLSNRTADHAAGAWGLWVINADGSNPQRLPIDLPFVYTDVEEQMVDWGP